MRRESKTLDRAISKKISQSSERLFHITVGVAATSALNINNDLRLLRTALLYADQVKLCSFTASYLYTMFRFASSLEGFWDGMEDAARAITDGSRRSIELMKVDYYRSLLRKKRRTREELMDLGRMKSNAIKFQENLERQYFENVQLTEFDGIQRAIDAELLALHTYKTISYESLANSLVPETGDLQSLNKTSYEEFMTVLFDAFQDKTTYPLFDHAAGLLTMNELNQSAQQLSKVRLAQAKHSATAANMLERLPDFGLTPIDSVLDIRKELRPYLDRFRSGIKTYSTKIESAPWSEEFAPEADEVFIQDVKPAFLELEDAIKRNRSILTEMKDAKSILGYVTSASGSVLGCFIDDYAALPLYAKFIFGLGTAMATPLLQWALNLIQPDPAIKRHHLYFYYRLRDRVERS